MLEERMDAADRVQVEQTGNGEALISLRDYLRSEPDDEGAERKIYMLYQYKDVYRDGMAQEIDDDFEAALALARQKEARAAVEAEETREHLPKKLQSQQLDIMEMQAEQQYYICLLEMGVDINDL